MEDLKSGDRLGRYQIVRPLGEGGMGMVYQAYDPVLKREVAIKVIHPHLVRKPDLKERFRQEAVAAARLKHPGIVQVHDSGEDNHTLYIVMEFISGGNLEEMLEALKKKGQWLVLKEAVEIVQQVSLAVEHTHQHGVLHRDIKPGNIMLERGSSGNLPYRPILTDLGLAKLAEGGLETQTGISMGTPAYMSPEQARGEAVDVCSDVYSLGALLYHLCVGKPPFPVKTISEAIRIHVQALTPASPRSLNPTLPPELDAVILKALARDAGKRFTNAGQLAQALGKLLPKLAELDDPDRTALDPAAGVSLASMLEHSQAIDPGQAILGKHPVEPAKAGSDRIQVIEPRPAAQQGEERAMLRLNQIQLDVEPGGSVSLEITLINLSNQVDHYRVRVEGIPQAWVRNLPKDLLQCMPGDEQRVTLFLQPPRAPQSKAGHHPFNVHAESTGKPGQIVSASANLTIGKYLQFTSQLKPQKVQAGTAAQVIILNQGNSPEPFRLEFQDPADEILFKPGEGQLQIAEGQSAIFQYQAQPRHRHWFGNPRSYSFSTTVKPSAGDAQALQGELISQAVLARSFIHTSGGEGRVGIYIDSVQVSVEPGQSAILPIILLNMGKLVDQFRISISGIDKAWTKHEYIPKPIMPGDHHEVALAIQPPRSPSSKAGNYPLTISVASQAKPDEIASATVTLTVRQYLQFTTQLNPQKVLAGTPAKIIVFNQGNYPETFSLKFQDSANQLQFEVDKSNLVVPEGQSAAFQYIARPRQRHWFGRDRTYSFSAIVGPHASGLQSLQGEVVSHAVFQMLGLILLVLFLCLLICFLGYYFLSIVINSGML
jgi:serine/threonine protein kinase